MRRFLLPAALAVCGAVPAELYAEGGTVLNLSRYLQLVRQENLAAQGSAQSKSGAEGRKREADLIFAPSFFANGEVSSDAKPQDFNMMGNMYNRLETRKYSAGLSQTYNFGLQAKLYYSLSHVHYFFPSQSDTSLYDGSPVLELTQSLWQNAKGRYDRSKEESTRAQADSDKWSAENDMRSLLVSAEKAYWNLAVCREMVGIRKSAVEDAQAILDYDMKRAKMNLMDKSDVLQAKASLESKKLELKSAQDSADSAMRAFRSYINLPEGTDAAVEPINWKLLMSLSSPDRPGDRADVQMAQASAAQSAASSRMNAENDKPLFNIYLTQTLNGQDPNLTGMTADSLNLRKPSTTVGLKFSIPLEYDAQKQARFGAEQKEAAAALTYRQKVLDQESDWRDLIASLRDARSRLEMAFSIEAAQKEKLEYEKKRLREGRTTTYQVLSFEQDYSQSQYDRVTLAATLLSLAAQVKLYGELPQPASAPAAK